MNLMMLTPNGDSKNHPLFGRTTLQRSVVGSSKETADCEIAKTNSITEAAKIVSERMANKLADELRRITETTLEPA